MKNVLKHVLYIAGGLACVAAGVIIPPAAPVLGTLAAKLLIAGGGSLALALVSPENVKAAVMAARKK